MSAATAIGGRRALLDVWPRVWADRANQNIELFVESHVPPFRYRLTDAATGADLGPFLSKRTDWQPGDRIGRSKGGDMVILAVIDPDDEAGFRAYLVVVPAESETA